LKRKKWLNSPRTSLSETAGSRINFMKNWLRIKTATPAATVNAKESCTASP
jgi:hypothetical protein